MLIWLVAVGGEALADAQLALGQFRTGRTQPAAILQFVFQVFLDPRKQLRLLGLDVQAWLVLRVGLGDVDDFID